MKPPPEPHGVMLHYAHGNGHPPTQGSLSADDLRRLLDVYAYRLRTAAEWLAVARNTALTVQVCVTIDDGLREALDVFLPVLEERRLTACWNVYTQPLVGVPHSLERYRWIRNHALGDVEGFYRAWGLTVNLDMLRRLATDYRKDYAYLTEDDRLFRYWRDCHVSEFTYRTIMEGLGGRRVDQLGLDHWLSANDLRALRAGGHVIGLHTHTHPTVMSDLSCEQQATEWATSKYILESILGEPVTTAAWPCGNVTGAGVAWMKAHGITLAWGVGIPGALPYNAPRWSSGNWRSAK